MSEIKPLTRTWAGFARDLQDAPGQVVTLEHLSNSAIRKIRKTGATVLIIKTYQVVGEDQELYTRHNVECSWDPERRKYPLAKRVQILEDELRVLMRELIHE